MVQLPPSLLPELRQQIQCARAVWAADRQNRTPLMLPHQLAKKYPDYRLAMGLAVAMGAQWTSPVGQFEA